jgi:hypothetical protein
VNLRFYVYPEGKPEQRSVTFVKEIVPKRAIPLIANTFFGERYYVEPMWHSFDDQSFDYQWGKGRRYRFLARNIPPLAAPANGSLTEFITEHYWGYSKMNDKTIEYQVEHVPWSCAEVRDFEVKMDFAAHYGESFKVLDSADPVNVLYAQGSPVSVSFPSTYRLAADKSG